MERPDDEALLKGGGRHQKPRVCLVTQFFPPEMGAPQGRLYEQAVRLRSGGWAVRVVTAVPNYPTGRVFAGYPRMRWLRETLGEMEVVRLPMWPSSQGIVPRVISQLSFAASVAALGLFTGARPDVVYVESPPLFAAVAARWLAGVWRCPYVLNVSDLWPDSAVHLGYLSDGPLLRLGRSLEAWLYRGAGALSGQSREIVSHIERVHPRARVIEVTNGVEMERFGRHLADREAKEWLGPAEGPVFLYAGLLGHAQGLERILDVIRGLPPTTPGRLVLMGDGPLRESLAERLARGQDPRVTLRPAVPRERVPAVLAAADVALIPLATRLPGAVPSKVYEAMATGLPILLVADGEPRDRVVEAACGLAVSPGDPRAFVRAFERLTIDRDFRDVLGQRGIRAARERYSRESTVARLGQLLRETVEPGDVSPPALGNG